MTTRTPTRRGGRRGTGSGVLYKVSLLSEGQVWEIYCRNVSPSLLLGFIELEDFQFGEKTQVVVDPAEERLKSVFEGVERTHVPMHAVLRIDEVRKRGKASIHEAGSGTDPGSKILTLPPFLPPGRRR